MQFFLFWPFPVFESATFVSDHYACHQLGLTCQILYNFSLVPVVGSGTGYSWSQRRSRPTLPSGFGPVGGGKDVESKDRVAGCQKCKSWSNLVAKCENHIGPIFKQVCVAPYLPREYRRVITKEFLPLQIHNCYLGADSWAKQQFLLKNKRRNQRKTEQ